jgi:soluble lytic murein transglycosylase-like protein
LAEDDHGNLNRETLSPAWLVMQSGPSAGARFLIRGQVTRIGRDESNDIVIQGENAAVVSSRHLEIRCEDNNYLLRDLSSTNGTFLNGKRVSEATLKAQASIRLGGAGPELRFEIGAAQPASIDRTMLLSTRAVARAAEAEKEAQAAEQKSGEQHEELLSQAVLEARAARHSGFSGQTHIIMRKMLGDAIRRSGKKWKTLVGLLIVILAGVSAFGYWKIQDLQKEKSDIDEQIQTIEAALEEGGQDPEELTRLVERLESYQTRAKSLQENLLYRIGGEAQEQAFIQKEIATLMEEFGAETYSIPPEFVEQVNIFIQQFQERDRPHVERALGRSRKDLDIIREVMQQENLPPDLAYMVLVESAFLKNSMSPAGAAGPWQFTSETARQYGMRVNEKVDERFDLRKSTKAASRYIRELILDFGSGSSVMLALAAYNLGPGKVKRAIRKVEDPIKQRNFWYLYRVRALPIETRQYVPKIIAGMVIGRNPERFGF